MASANNTSDFNQWLHAMKMVARLPGGMPPEFRRKLWLALAERHLQTNLINWEKEETRCLSEPTNRDDDEELEVQIVKDLHRTGSSLFSGPAGSLNQAKLKRILIGYARWNPSVGYCQGFNMLGALILQVMDKSEIESLKVMIFLIEGILPSGYFSGSLSGLQTDMAVFRDIMAIRLPKLAKHLQKLQGPIGEGSFEPPLTNVFTMQWFLTLFCTCLPYNCVLRVWDLVLIEGSDILLRSALAIWGLLEKRILQNKTADEFYCNMGMLSSELLNGHLFDSNGLIQKVVELGPIPELQSMRDKHIYNITPWKDKRGLRLFFSDDEGDSDDDSRAAALTNAWGIRLGGRRGSLGLGNLNNTNNSGGPNVTGLSTSTNTGRPVSMHENRERIALDISLLKKQYDKLCERQRQAHIILTQTARQSVDSATNSTKMPPVNQYLLGKNAIVSKGRRIGPPAGSIPPIRKPIIKVSPKQHKKVSVTTATSGSSSSNSSCKTGVNNVPSSGTTKKLVNTVLTIPAVKDSSSSLDKPSSSGVLKNATLHKSPSVTSTNSSLSDSSMPTVTSNSRKKSESSSYSDDDNNDDSDENSSTSTSLCDDDNLEFSVSSIEASPLKKKFAQIDYSKPSQQLETSPKLDACLLNQLRELNVVDSCFNGDSKSDFVGNVKDSSTTENESGNFIAVSGNNDNENNKKISQSIVVPIQIINSKLNNNSNISKSKPLSTVFTKDIDAPFISVNNTQTIDDLISQSTNICTTTTTTITSITPNKIHPEIIKTKFQLSPVTITSTSQLSPIADISKYLSNSSISPLRTPASFLDYANGGDNSSIIDKDSSHDCNENYKNEVPISSPSTTFKDKSINFQVNEDGVTNEYFERLNAQPTERPCRLELQHIVLIQQQKISTEELSTSNSVCSINFEQITKGCSDVTTTTTTTTTTVPLLNCRLLATEDIPTAVPDGDVIEPLFDRSICHNISENALTPVPTDGILINSDVLEPLPLTASNGVFSTDINLTPDDTTPSTIKNEKSSTLTMDTEWNNYHISDNEDSSEHLLYDNYYINENPTINDDKSIDNLPNLVKSNNDSPLSSSLASISENQLLIIDNVSLLVNTTTSSRYNENSESQSDEFTNKINDDDLKKIITSSPPTEVSELSLTLLPSLSEIINDNEENKLMLSIDFNSQKRHSNRALQIIEENSLILDKILKKTLATDKDVQSDSLVTSKPNDYYELATGSIAEKECTDKEAQPDSLVTSISNDYYKLETVSIDEKDCTDKEAQPDSLVTSISNDYYKLETVSIDEKDCTDKEAQPDSLVTSISIDYYKLKTVSIGEKECTEKESQPNSLVTSKSNDFYELTTVSTVEKDSIDKEALSISLGTSKLNDYYELATVSIGENDCTNIESQSDPLKSTISNDYHDLTTVSIGEYNCGNEKSNDVDDIVYNDDFSNKISDKPSSLSSSLIVLAEMLPCLPSSSPITITKMSPSTESIDLFNKDSITLSLRSIKNQMNSLIEDNESCCANNSKINFFLNESHQENNQTITETLNSIKNTVKSVDDACSSPNFGDNNCIVIDEPVIINNSNKSVIGNKENVKSIEVNVKNLSNTNDNDINQTLDSIKNTIKCVDNACWENKINTIEPNQNQHKIDIEIIQKIDNISETLQSTQQNTVKAIEKINNDHSNKQDDSSSEYQSESKIAIEDKASILEYKSNKNSIVTNKTYGNDINETIYSIKNTIKSINTLCEEEKKKLNSRSHHKHNNSSSSSSERIRFQFDSNENNASSSLLSSSSTKCNSCEPKDLKYLEFQRYSRDTRREISPRRYRDDDVNEYESRTKRDISSLLSSSTSRLSNSHYDKDKSKYIHSLPPPTSGINITVSSGSAAGIGKGDINLCNDDSSITMYKSHDSNLNLTSKDQIGSRFIKFQSTDKFSIRHTTVTSTFYDRFLSQKMERRTNNVRMDKSPIKITQNYLDSFKLLPRTYYNRDRPKSAENSPSKSNFDLLSNNDDMLQTATTTTMSVSMSDCSKKINDHNHGGGGDITDNKIGSSATDKLNLTKIITVPAADATTITKTTSTPSTLICSRGGSYIADSNDMVSNDTTITEQSTTAKSNS